MADLMTTATEQFDELMEKYNNFMAPSYNIKIEGSSITDNNKIVESIKIDISSKGVAGMCEIVLCDCYDHEEKSFKSDIKSKLVLGKKISISLGYSNTNTELFIGYIDSINYEFNEYPTITVVCMDVIQILMQNYSVEQKGKEIGLSEMVSEILNANTKYFDSSEIASVSATGMQIAKICSDYEFIKRIADENGFEFFVLSGIVYFRKAKSVKTNITKLQFGKHIINFSREEYYKNISVTVMGKDDVNKVTTKGNFKGKTKGSSNGFISNKIIISGNINSDDKAAARAKIEADRILENAYSAELECVGMPEIVPGRYVELADFDNDMNGNYYIFKVRHIFSAGNYRVIAELSDKS